MGKYLAIFGKPRYLGILEYSGEEEPAKGSWVVAESHRGEELALIAGPITPEQEHEYRLLRSASEHGDGGSKAMEPLVTDLTFISHAGEEDLATAEVYREEERGILKNAKELLKLHELDMKLIDVEFLRQRRKLFFYFSSEQRVDFRAYVRDLAREFKTRIELRQIGVRDEAKIIKGLGPCGEPCCCSYWLNQFAPICIKMVKEQNLALNPTKISGICGRLMCCMYYEHNVYRELWERLPNPGTKIKTPNGNVVVSGVELHSDSVRCYVPTRGEIKIPIKQFEEFKETVMSGREWILPEPEEVILPAFDADLFERLGGSRDKKSKRRREDPDREGARKGKKKEQAPAAETKPAGPKPAKKRRRPRKFPSAPKEEIKEKTKKETPQKTEQQPMPSGERPKGGAPKNKPRRPRRRKGADTAKSVRLDIEE